MHNIVSKSLTALHLVKSASVCSFFCNERRTEHSIQRRPSESRFSNRDYASPLCLEMNVNIHRVTHALNDILPEPQWEDCRRSGAWCGNYVTKRSAQNSNSLSNCYLFCLKMGDVLLENKEIWMDKHKNFQRVLFLRSLDELKWLWLWAEIQETHWGQFHSPCGLVTNIKVWQGLKKLHNY